MHLNRQSYILSFLLLIVVALFCSCDGDSTPPVKNKPPKTNAQTLKVPAFNADSAYTYIQTQVDFGPRVPGTDTHKSCAEWLEQKLGSYADKVQTQKSTVTTFDKTIVPMYNVIGSFNPTSKERILLCAHWDTRPFADQDVEDTEKPIAGANDGGSGVGVLLEVARQLAKEKVNLGVDIIFFDVEDYGKGAPDTYCLGSQHWSKTPHVPNYSAKYGILLDMVGAKGAVFYQEGNSLRYASPIVQKVWTAAHKAGYSSFFPFKKVGDVTDDHLFINLITGIPTIDIIQYDDYTGFGEFWHTHDDNMEVIDRRTLKAVGQTVLRTIYSEDADNK